MYYTTLLLNIKQLNATNSRVRYADGNLLILFCNTVTMLPFSFETALQMIEDNLHRNITYSILGLYRH